VSPSLTTVGTSAAAPQPGSVTAQAVPLAAPAAITTAFAVGWQMASLFAKTPKSERAAAAAPAEEVPPLQSVSSWPVEEQRRLLACQLQTEVGRLKIAVAAAGVPRVLSQMLDLFIHRAEVLAASAEKPADLRPRLITAHKDLQMALMAADFRLGKAYDLGRALADTCLLPKDKKSFEGAFSARLVAVEDGLADIASNLPPHSARAVSLSLRTWEVWSVNPRLENQPLTWPNPAVSAALHRQGEVWRSLLSGEKLGQDMLEAADYFSAFRALIRRTLRLGPWLAAILLGILVALAGGIYLLVAQHGTVAKLVGSALSALAALGITGSALRRRLTSVGTEFDRQIWQAELDWAIADAITVAPGRWNVKLRKIEMPARGRDPRAADNTATFHELSNAIRGRGIKAWKAWKLWKLRSLLHSTCKHERDGEPVATEGKVVADWLMQQPYLADAPEALWAGRRPGTLLSAHLKKADPVQSVWLVWTFRHGKVSQLEEFGDDKRGAYNAAWLVVEITDAPLAPTSRPARQA
jgi:hypothetical protein